MNKDLTYILDGQTPRAFGELPSKVGNYEMIAPSDYTDKLIKALNGKDKTV